MDKKHSNYDNKCQKYDIDWKYLLKVIPKKLESIKIIKKSHS